MPELPEVETIKRELASTIIGKKIVKVLVNSARVIRQPDAASFKKGLTGVTFKDVMRKGKLLVIAVSSGEFLCVHLKMTGQLVYPGNGKSSRVSFLLSDGKLLDFNDQRLFGELRLLDDWRSLKFIQELGPEPFELDAKNFSAMLSGRRTRIKPLLMDQSFISGIGNLYAAESLFRSGINPGKPANGLSEKEKTLLLSEIKSVLNEAIRCGGSSIDDYVQVSGKQGGYVPHLKVYGRQGKPCLVCGAAIKRTTLGGRGTFFCPRCQK